MALRPATHDVLVEREMTMQMALATVAAKRKDNTLRITPKELDRMAAKFPMIRMDIDTRGGGITITVANEAIPLDAVPGVVYYTRTEEDEVGD